MRRTITRSKMLEFAECDTVQSESAVATVFLSLFLVFVLSDLVVSARAINNVLGKL